MQAMLEQYKLDNYWDFYWDYLGKATGVSWVLGRVAVAILDQQTISYHIEKMVIDLEVIVKLCAIPWQIIVEMA